jgi:N-acetylglucosaminyldiphosphoundecaprenol N-acetyl-beta-D-mannosaminyltransferase
MVTCAPKENGLLNAPTDNSTLAVPSIVLFGVRFHLLRMEDVLALFQQVIRSRKPVQVSFANAQTVAMCWRDPSLRAVVNGSHYTFADGMSIVWGARMLGTRIPGRIAGPDATASLCRLAAERNQRIFLLGSSIETLTALKRSLEENHPGIVIAGMFSPAMTVKFSADQSDEMIRVIRQANADILLVGLSFPKQERWISENIDRLDVPLCLGVGAAFDFLSSRIPRAPEWIQKRGFEWLFRLWCEPRRLWRRYLWGNLIFLGLLLSERLKKKFSEASIRP